MAESNGHVPEKPRYINFPSLEPGTVIDGKQALNRWSHTITRGRATHAPTANLLLILSEHDFPGAQAMLYAAGVPNRDMMKSAPQVG